MQRSLFFIALALLFSTLLPSCKKEEKVVGEEKFNYVRAKELTDKTFNDENISEAEISELIRQLQFAFDWRIGELNDLMAASDDNNITDNFKKLLDKEGFVNCISVSDTAWWQLVRMQPDLSAKNVQELANLRNTYGKLEDVEKQLRKRLVLITLPPADPPAPPAPPVAPTDTNTVTNSADTMPGVKV